LQQTWKMGWHVQDFVMVFLIQHSSCKSIKLDKSRSHTKKDTSRWIYLGMNWMTWSPLFATVESCMYNPKCSNADKDIWVLVLTLAVAALDHLIITGKTHISLSLSLSLWAFSLPVLFSEMGFFSQGCNACWRSLRNELPLGEHGVLKPQISCLSQVGRLCIY
jgi:L-asparagine transporter-like permease